MAFGKSILISLALALTLAGCSTLMDAQDESHAAGPADNSPIRVLDKVDVPPTVTFAPQAQYPRIAQQAGLEGTVWVQAVIDTLGHVQDAKVQTSSGTQSLDEAGLAAAWKFRFKPAVRDGEPVPVSVSFPIEFRLAR